MNNNNNTEPQTIKKRKTNNDSTLQHSLSEMKVAEQEQNNNNELLELKDMMKQMMEYNSTQLSSIQIKMDIVTERLTSMETKIDQLEERNGQLESSLDNMTHKNGQLESSLENMKHQQKYQEVLLKNQKWDYPADDRETRTALSILQGLFIGQSKKVTREIRYGIGNCGNGQVHFDLDHFTHTIHILLPHWTEFCKALEDYKYCLRCLPEECNSSFQITNMQLLLPTVTLLVKALSDTNFKALRLESNSMMDRSGFEFVVNYVRSNPILKVLSLKYNFIHDGEDMNQLCEVINAHPSLNSISLVACNGDEITGYDMLYSLITAGGNKLVEINLTDNSIITGRSTFLHDFLNTNPPLQKLILQDNHLDNVDATFIASALQQNTNLRYIDLRENPITDEGTGSLKITEFDRSSLNGAASSNHTCLIIYPDNDEVMNENGTGIHPEERLFNTKLVRAKKIYIVLSTGNITCSNFQQLEDAPIEVLPTLLTSIQQYSTYHEGDADPNQYYDDVSSLSLVYEVMRYWEPAVSVFDVPQP